MVRKRGQWHKLWKSNLTLITLECNGRPLMSHGNNTYPKYNYMVNYRQYPPKYNKEECDSLGIVSDTMMKSPTNLSCGSQRMGMQTGEGKKWLMLTTCCKIQGWETQVNCRQSWWTEGAGRAVCSTRGVLKDDQDEMRWNLTRTLSHTALVIPPCYSFHPILSPCFKPAKSPVNENGKTVSVRPPGEPRWNRKTMTRLEI